MWQIGFSRDGQQRLLAKAAASRMFTSAATENETIVLPRYDNESEIEVLHQLYSLRKPLDFDQLIGECIYYTSMKTISSDWDRQPHQ